MPQHPYADAVKFLLVTLAKETRDPGIELNANNHIAAINKFEAEQQRADLIKLAEESGVDKDFKPMSIADAVAEAKAIRAEQDARLEAMQKASAPVTLDPVQLADSQHYPGAARNDAAV